MWSNIATLLASDTQNFIKLHCVEVEISRFKDVTLLVCFWVAEEEAGRSGWLRRYRIAASETPLEVALRLT